MNDTIDLGGSTSTSYSWGKVGQTQPGAFVVGRVLALAEVQATDYDGPNAGKPSTWDNGDPKMQYRVTLQTDLRDPGNATDDGRRDVYLDGSRKRRDNGTASKLCAVLDAVRAVTGGTALAVGGYLKLTWVSGVGYSGDPRNFEAQYQAPSVDLGAPAQGTVPGAQPATLAGPPNPLAQPGAVGADPFAQQAQANPWAAAGAPAAPPVAQAPAQPVAVPQGQPVAAPAAQDGPTPEQVAAVKAGGMDPAVVWPGFVEA